MDTRAYRLSCLSHVDVYELDRQEVFTYKEHVLSQHTHNPHTQLMCRSLHRVPAELVTPELTHQQRQAAKRQQKLEQSLKHRAEREQQQQQQQAQKILETKHAVVPDSACLAPSPSLSTSISTSMSMSTPTSSASSSSSPQPFPRLRGREFRKLKYRNPQLYQAMKQQGTLKHGHQHITNTYDTTQSNATSANHNHNHNSNSNGNTSSNTSTSTSTSTPTSKCSPKSANRFPAAASNSAPVPLSTSSSTTSTNAGSEWPARLWAAGFRTGKTVMMCYVLAFDTIWSGM